jgi:hypothetical protein
MVQQLSQPSGVLQKEPSQHRLKSRGRPVIAGLAATRSPAGLIAAAQHQPQLLVAEQGMKALEDPGLGLRLDLTHHGPM